MTNNNTPPRAAAKRNDVGYKRPPAEHQFKKGGKPPPRKAKAVLPEFSPTQILWDVLREQRRVLIDGKPVWLSNAELIWRKAMQLAEAGNATMQRAVNGVLFSLDEGKPKLNARARLVIDGVDKGYIPDWADETQF
jgi:hypothetical protein